MSNFSFNPDDPSHWQQWASKVSDHATAGKLAVTPALDQNGFPVTGTANAAQTSNPFASTANTAPTSIGDQLTGGSPFGAQDAGLIAKAGAGATTAAQMAQAAAAKQLGQKQMATGRGGPQDIAGVNEQNANAQVTDLANQNASNFFSDVTKNANSIMSGAETNFENKQQQQEAGISSAATGLSKSLGVGAGSSAASAAKGASEANAGATKPLVMQDALNKVNDYVNTAVSSNLQDQTSLANLSADQKTQYQGQIVQSLGNEIQNAISSGQLAAGANTDQLQAAMTELQNATKKGEANQAQWNKVLGLFMGAATAGVGAGLIASGAGAPVGAGLVAAGAGQIARS